MSVKVDSFAYVNTSYYVFCLEMKFKIIELHVISLNHSFLQAENILAVDLDMPNRTTRDYEGPSVAPRVQAALDAALQDEDDLDLEVQWV